MTEIEWTDEVWNPTTGCSKESAGCKNCYAERMANRLRGRCGYPADDPFRVTLHPDRLAKPFHWKKQRRIFVNSMGDLFHEAVSFDFIAAVFGVMAACPNHIFQVLTKRPLQMEMFLKWVERLPAQQPQERKGAPVAGYLGEYAIKATKGTVNIGRNGELPPWPLPNVWLGVTTEDQETADERIPLLLQCPAKVRFVSCEPLIDSVDLSRYLLDADGLNLGGGWPQACGLDWVIVGGETGPKARAMHPGWVRGVRDQCQSVSVPFFFKQWGVWREHSDNWQGKDPKKYKVIEYQDKRFVRLGKKGSGRVLDDRTWEEMPIC